MLTLDRVVGQSHAVTLLQRALSGHEGRLHHAYLFAGPPGVGKRSCALAFAAALVCPEAPDVGCGTCHACAQVASGTHPDVLHLVPDRTKARPEIKIEQVREELLPKLAFLPNEAPCRVVVVEDADLMNPVAANALLKTLEEPPEATRFVLTCDAPSRLPPTVLSRCQRVRFAPLEEAALARLLEERHGLPAADAAAVARLAEGSPGRALEAAAAGDASTQAEIARRVLGGAIDGSTAQLGGDAWAQRALLPPALQLARRLLRDALLEQATPGSSDRLVCALAARTPTSLLAAAQTIEDTRLAIEGNANPQLWLESLVLRLGRTLGEVRR